VRIVVTVKNVPDVSVARALGADGRLVRDQGDDTLNELDENAVQAAVDVARACGGEVVAVSLGSAQAVSAVRHALQLGADRGVLVSDDALAGADALATATALAAAVVADGPVPDLVVCGASATDGLTGLVPDALAARLGVPAVTEVADLTVADGRVVARRDLAGVTEQVEVPLPAVVSVTDALNEPSVPGFKAIFAAKKKPVARVGADDLARGLATLGLDASALASRTRVVTAQPSPPRTDQVIVEDDGTAAQALAAWLVDRRLV
jgi:electron transfer flavoprotein beta subunit